VTQVIPLRYESAAQLVNVLRPMITPSNTIAAFPERQRADHHRLRRQPPPPREGDRSLDQPPGGEPVVVPLRHASAIDLVPTLTRLLADPSGVQGDPQQRVTVVADARSNSVLVRADNPGRAARVRQLIEQLDTAGRAGGNMFIVYLRNAEAARVVQTLRALLTGQDSSAPSTGGLAPQNPGTMSLGTTSVASSPAGTQALPYTGAQAADELQRGRRDDLRRHREQRARDPRVRAGLQQPARRHREARRAARAGLRRGADRRDLRRQGRRVRHPVAGAERRQQHADARRRRDQLRTRGTGTNIIDIAANLGAAAPGLNLGVIRGTVNIPGLGIIQNLGFLARALETQVNANILSTPTLLTLDNEEARIVVGQNVPFVTGQYANTAWARRSTRSRRSSGATSGSCSA
jgi:general secretion pathway protein D